MPGKVPEYDLEVEMIYDILAFTSRINNYNWLPLALGARNAAPVFPLSSEVNIEKILLFGSREQLAWSTLKRILRWMELVLVEYTGWASLQDLVHAQLASGNRDLDPQSSRLMGPVLRSLQQLQDAGAAAYPFGLYVGPTNAFESPAKGEEAIVNVQILVLLLSVLWRIGRENTVSDFLGFDWRENEPRTIRHTTFVDFFVRWTRVNQANWDQWRQVIRRMIQDDPVRAHKFEAALREPGDGQVGAPSEGRFAAYRRRH